MLYVIIVIAAVIVAVLLLRLRLRLLLSDRQKLLFVGLGRSGSEFDFSAGTSAVKVFGLKFGTRKLGRKPGAEREPGKKPKKKARKPRRRQRPVGYFLRVIPGVVKAVGAYLTSMLRAVVVEYLDGEIEGGFASPHITGMAYGYYRAALAAAGPVAGRLRFRPVWEGPSFDGTLRASFAVPLYSLAWRTILLVFRLPLRDLTRLAIGKKKGETDDQ
ncbi:MAG: hypothetical protein JSW34_10010 [Candidatus Zixiibacteriota bacterium]|nr:MAG: hypothetical protein JSW34_10010 [candidate division Zixibacteria bacterium]